MTLQHKIVAIPLCIMSLMVVVCFILIQDYMKSRLGQRIEAELGHVAMGAIEALDSMANRNDVLKIDELADRLGHATNTRITFIRPDGTVMGDSKLTYQQVLDVENHANRPEVVGAVKSGKSISKRHSATINQDLLYLAVAKKFPGAEGVYVARASMPLSEIAEAVTRLRWLFAIASCVCLFFVMLLGLAAGSLVNNAVRREKNVLEMRVKDRTRIILTMQAMTGLLNTCASIDEAGAVVNKVMPVLLPHISGAISIIKSSRNRLDVLLSWGRPWPGRSAFLPTECWALRRGHQHCSTTNNLRVLCDHMDADITAQTVCIPLIAQGETIGVFHAIGDKVEISSEDIELIASVSEQIGLALANIQLRDSLREQAIRDPLTSLYNRRYMLEALDQMVSRSKRQHKTMAVMMVDVDHFKRFNDTFGHKVGDVVLSNIASELKHRLRVEDTACRYGGEEFCLVCPDISAVEAIVIAEKLCEAIRRLDLHHEQKPLGKLSISVGVALFPDQGITTNALIQKADELLYLAKEQGRDRVVMTETNKVVSQFASDDDVAGEDGLHKSVA